MNRFSSLLQHPKGESLRAFLLVFLCLFLLFSLLATYSYQQSAAREATAYAQQMSSACAQMGETLGLTVSSVRTACNMVFSQRWYQHYRNVSGIYDYEFDPLHRLEITGYLSSIAAAYAFIDDVLVITPALNSVIAATGWYTPSSYERIYGRIHIEDQGDWSEFPQIETMTDAYSVVVLPDYNHRHYKSVVVLLINRRAFSAQVEPFLSEEMLGVEISLHGHPLFAWGTLDAQGAAFEHTASQIDMTVRMHAHPVSAQIASMRTVYILVMALALVASAVLAQVTAWINFAPLRRTIARLTGTRQELNLSPHASLSQYITTVSHNNSRLSDENATLHESINRFLSGKKNEILLGMLLRPDFEFDDPFVHTLFPWLMQKQPLWMALLQPQEDEPDLDWSAFAVLEQDAAHYILLPLFTGGACLMFWFQTREDFISRTPDITARLEVLCSHTLQFVTSNLIDRPSDINAAYLTLQARLEEARRTRTYLPLPEQTQFVVHLQSGKLADCLEQLKEARERHSPDAYMLLLSRIATEYHVDISEGVMMYGSQRRDTLAAGEWNVLASITSDLSRAIVGASRNHATELADLLCRYIQDHFCDPELSVKMLADRFFIHRSMVSKLVKTSTGESFSDYCLTLRMHHAQQLLRTSQESITQIAQQSGYDSYTSFKRAFIRFQGISPREYREAISRQPVE